MIQLFKSIPKQKIISFLLIICMILPVIPMLGVSAAASGITYYENNFELPLYGSTGCPVKDVPVYRRERRLQSLRKTAIT